MALKKIFLDCHPQGPVYPSAITPLGKGLYGQDLFYELIFRNCELFFKASFKISYSLSMAVNQSAIAGFSK
jgi:hypothetical protein